MARHLIERINEGKRMSLHEVSPRRWVCMLAGLSVGIVLGIGSAVRAADMEVAPFPAADFELSLPEVYGPPRSDFEYARPEIEQRLPADLESAHHEIDHPPMADFEHSRPEIHE
jgi:hypothetical protein